MARGRQKKEVVLYNNKWKGKMLSEKECDKLDLIRRIGEDENGNIEDLKHIIYDLNPSDVDLVIETGSTEFVEKKKGTLENHQTVGVAYMYFAKRLVLGDSVGLGKTVEVAGLCNLLQVEMEKEGITLRYLMLTEKTSVEEIRSKMVKFTGEYAETLYGEKDKILKFRKNWGEDEIPPNTVGTHSLLTSVHFQEYVMGYIQKYGYSPYDLIIIDEAGSVLANTATKTYNTAMYFSEICDRVILLNATSFESQLDNFYAQLNFIDKTFMPTKTDIEARYKKYVYGIMPYPVFQGEYQNEDEFKSLVGYRYLQRTRRQLNARMEDCTADIVISDLSKEQKELLKLVSIPQMVYDCPGYFNRATDIGIETNPITTPKLRDLLSLVTELKKNGPILVYARYKESQKCIIEELRDIGVVCEMMNGETPQKERTNLTNKFKLGDLDVLVTNVQKALDFGDCNYCIFYDYDSNPNKMVQFEGRMTRSIDIIGKHVYLLVSRGGELNSLKKIVSNRAKASDLFAGSDYSCVLSLLLDNEVVKSWK